MLNSPITRRAALQNLTSAVAAAATLSLSQSASATAPRVLPAGQLPNDVRLGTLKDLNGDFTWKPSASVAEWEQRAAYLRRQILVACGLWPMPARPEIQATITGKIERDGYTVEKVFFESHPGLYVTGNLYRPVAGEGKKPGVLCPYGHWADGRFHDHGEAKVKQELELKAEMFEVGGRHPVQARCVHLARMGCVVFNYDMLGYADNVVMSYDLIHRFAKQRPEMSAPDHWGLFSAQSELRLLSALGLQTWNSIRALDWLEKLPDVDSSRLAVTGASGGGTQTFMLGAVDPRPIAFFPAVMVSTAMQGGCSCENASLLRVGTGNIEFAALIAPRTLGMSAANDWTKELETKGLPELKQHYQMLGAGDQVSGKYFPYEHNYNHPSRKMMYEIFQKALKLPGSSVVEADFQPLSVKEASVWTAEHPAPPAGDAAELSLLQAFAKEFDEQLAALTPRDPASLTEYRRVVGGGWEAIVGRTLKTAGTVTTRIVSTSEISNGPMHTGVIRNETFGEELPSSSLVPREWNRQVVLWLNDAGHRGLFGAEGQPIPAVHQLLTAGYAVAGVDLLYQGEFLSEGTHSTETRRVNNPREFLGFTTGYNSPLLAQRVHDVLSTIKAIQEHSSQPVGVHLVGTGQSGIIAAVAAAQAGDAIKKLALATNGYRFSTITDIGDPMLLPGAVRYGDVPGVLALRAPFPLLLAGEDAKKLAVVHQAYAVNGQSKNLAVSPTLEDQLVAWLKS